jgi:benzoylformate decarboxylase
MANAKTVHDTTEKLAAEFTAALTAEGPTVIMVRTKPQLTHLV